jgi:hypothetical protein
MKPRHNFPRTICGQEYNCNRLYKFIEVSWIKSLSCAHRKWPFKEYLPRLLPGQRQLQSLLSIASSRQAICHGGWGTPLPCPQFLEKSGFYRKSRFSFETSGGELFSFFNTEGVHFLFRFPDFVGLNER